VPLKEGFYFLRLSNAGCANKRSALTWFQT